MFEIMLNWQGSGRYDNGFVELTEIGKLFYEKLQKRSYDPDLTFRIEEWQTESLEIGGVAVKRKIDNYLLGYFSAQKKKNKFL